MKRLLYPTHLLTIIATVFLFLGISAESAPGDSSYAYDTYDYGQQIGFMHNNILEFGSPIQGSNHGDTKAAACRFVSAGSGVVEKMGVTIYSYNTTTEVYVRLYLDEAGRRGQPFYEAKLNNFESGRWNGRLIFPTRDVALQKGIAYWVGIEPANAECRAIWALGKAGPKGKRVKIENGEMKYSTALEPGNATNITVQEPFPPRVTSPTDPRVTGESLPNNPDKTLLELSKTPDRTTLTKVSGPSGKNSTIIGPDGSPVIGKGDPAPSLPGTKINSFKEPAGDAVLAKLKSKREGDGSPAIKGHNSTVLIGGLKDGTPRLLIQTGSELPGTGGAVLGSIVYVDANGSDVFFIAKLKGNGVKSVNDTALCTVLEDGTVRVLVREGDLVDGKPVTVIATLVSETGTTAEGRWRVDDHTIGVRLTFKDKSHAIYSIPSDANTPDDWQLWAATGDVLTGDLENETIDSFGLPAFGPGMVAFAAKLKPSATTNRANDTVILRGTESGLELVARKGSPAVNKAGEETSATFESFGSIVCGSKGKVAFYATVKEKKKTAGIWWMDASGGLRLVALVGDPAEGGGKFSKLTSLVLPDKEDSFPIIQAKLTKDPVYKIPKGALGLWGLNSEGNLRLLIRSGSAVVISSDVRGNVKSFAALVGSPKAPGVERGLDDQGRVLVNVVLKHNTTGKDIRLQFAVRVPTN